jgi:hypothetical protein
VQDYINNLINEFSRLDEYDATRQNMLTLLQVAVQLVPPIQANELPLEETITVSLQFDCPFSNITLQSCSAVAL